jgi:hypothetical protein
LPAKTGERYSGGMGKNTCERNVGRLLEIRVGKGYESVADVDEMMSMIGAKVAELPNQSKYVTAADWRRCSLMSAEAAERATAMLVRANPRTERSALLYSNDSPTAILQFVRLLNDAANPNRRMFVSANQMQSYLADVLNAEEAARLSVFLRG